MLYLSTFSIAELLFNAAINARDDSFYRALQGVILVGRCDVIPFGVQERRYKEAFSALSEAVKYKRESWQTWANYAHAAVQTSNHLQAARGVCQVACLAGVFHPHKVMLLAYLLIRQPLPATAKDLETVKVSLVSW